MTFEEMRQKVVDELLETSRLLKLDGDEENAESLRRIADLAKEAVRPENIVFLLESELGYDMENVLHMLLEEEQI